MIDNKAELPVVQKLLDRIVQSAQHIVALQTSSVADTVAQMRVLAMRGGTSIYAWDPDGGLASLRESGMTMIVVSHEMGFARAAADRVVFMDHGLIVEQGPPAQIFESPSHERTRAFIGQIQRH